MQRGFEFDVEFEVGGKRLSAAGLIRPGEVAVLQSPSGAGKTTLLRALCGLHPAEKIRASYDGQRVDCLPIERRGWGWIPQGAAILDALSPLDNMLLGLRARGMSRREAEKMVQPWIEKWRLTETIKNPTSGLSGGEAMRIAWVRAWVVQPLVMLMDEPFAGLDSEMADRMWSETVRTQTAVLIVTHHAEDIARIGKHGQIILNRLSN
jgi:putative spermidine/putrescine transport system ATP-binding protein